MLLRANKIKPEDAYRGVERIGRDAMQMLNVKPMDAVKISGRSETAARIWRGNVKPNEILMDEITMKNTGAEYGEEVLVEAIKPEKARRIVLKGYLKESWGWSFIAKTKEEYLRKLIEKKVVMANNDLAVLLPSGLFVLRVVETEPANVVVVDDSAQIELVLSNLFKD